MMNKLVIFDLDGVLIDSRMVHYEALNRALGKEFAITMDEHLSVYDGLGTTTKLKMLTKNKGLSSEHYDEIWKEKQRITIEIFDELQPDKELITFFYELKKNGYQIAIASNAIRNTVKTVLLRLGLLPYIDYYASNEDVKRHKPFPEMYWMCMTACGALPKDTVIIEDSHIGRQGALDSGAHLVTVEDRNDLSREHIHQIINILDKKSNTTIPWKSKNMNVLIPMAGAGSRFAAQGYTFPKPLIEVNGKPMIQVVVENLNIEAHYIFIVQKEHYEKYHLKYLLNSIAPGCDIVQVEGMTEGAACTTLIAEHLIDNDAPLVIANSDQYLDWDSNQCIYAFTAGGVDAGIVTFESSHPKWSYAKLNDSGFVCEVAEKKPISNHATVGVYYWKKGSDYVKYAHQMIAQDIRVNNEFYVCPVFNEAIEDGKKIRIKDAEKMWGIGTPEDLNYFLGNHKI